MSESKPFDQPTASGDLVTLLRGAAGAIVGAAVGFGIFTLLVKYTGIYAMAVPGALVGVVCGYCIQRRSLVLGIVCAGIAAANMIFVEWWNFPFIKDESLVFFLQNLGDLKPYFWFSLLLGGGLSILVWHGKRTNHLARQFVTRTKELPFVVRLVNWP